MSFQKEMDKLDKLNPDLTINLDMYMCKFLHRTLSMWLKEANEQFELEDDFKKEVTSICKELNTKLEGFYSWEDRTDIETNEYHEKLFARIGKILNKLWT